MKIHIYTDTPLTVSPELKARLKELKEAGKLMKHITITPGGEQVNISNGKTYLKQNQYLSIIHI